MSPVEAGVFIVDDDPDSIFLSKIELKKGQHRVVLTASTKAAALEAIPNLKEMGVDVVLLDNNLTPGDRSGKDGQEILNAIKAEDPNIKVVSYSSEKEPIVKGDATLSKAQFRELSKIVTEL